MEAEAVVFRQALSNLNRAIGGGPVLMTKKWYARFMSDALDLSPCYFNYPSVHDIGRESPQVYWSPFRIVLSSDSRDKQLPLNGSTESLAWSMLTLSLYPGRQAILRWKTMY